MRQQKKTTPQQTQRPDTALRSWRIALWLIIFGGTLFFWPTCLDRYLAPRFLFLSAAIIVSLILVWKDLRENGDLRLRGFDLLLLGWYGLNLASVSWSFSWSEGVFFAQKTLLLFWVYWFVRQAFLRDEKMSRQTMRQIITIITWTVCGVISVQVAMAIAQYGLDNSTLYEFASGLSGNKSLAADALFFLLVFNVMVYRDYPQRRDFWIAVGTIVLLILLLQTRTVYLALAGCLALYGITRAILEPDFRKLFLKRILPAAIVVVGLAATFVALKGSGSSLSERLNPLTYLDSESANERRFVWYKTDLLNKEHFWLGVGNGSWKIWFPSKNIDGGYRLEEQNIVFTRAHNDYLEIRSEMGIVGVVWFCALFFVAFLGAIWALSKKETPSEEHRNFVQDVLVAALGLLGYCVIQFFDFPRERIDMQVFLGVLFAWIVFYSGKKIPGTVGLSGIARPLLIALAGVGLTFNLLIGWNRSVGEIHNVRMMDAQVQNNWKTVVQESMAAENTFYEFTDVAMPLAWHEGVAWYQMGQMEKAVPAFEKAYRLNPWSFQVINNYASALVKHNQFREAVPLYEQALNINPSFDDGKMNLSFVHFKLGEYSKSLEWLARVDTIPNPGNDEDRQKNSRTKKRQAEFQKAVLEKMK